MRHRILVLVLFGLVALSGCKEIPGLISHNIDLNGAQHGKKLYREAKDCSACHGINLNGQAGIPGCYSCHGVMWNNADHKVVINGSKHKAGYMNATVNCAECHGGSSLKKENIHGKKRPGCYDCHDDKWTGLLIHSIDKGGKLHGVGYTTPSATGCDACHGSDLKGGVTAPSCYQCHGARWDLGSYSHSVSKGNKMHGPELQSPVGTCDSCHGSDLKGATGTGKGASCYSCHNAWWKINEYPHTKDQHGVAHGSDLNNPVGACDTCHGTDLRGSENGKSCYQCHGKKW